MAWVTLKDLIELEGNLGGVIPHTATVEMVTKDFRKYKPEDPINSFSLMKKGFVERLQQVDGLHTTIGTFMVEHDWATQIEWATVHDYPALRHFSDGMVKRDDGVLGYYFPTIIILDLTGWLKQQPLALRQEIFQKGWNWRYKQRPSEREKQVSRYAAALGDTLADYNFAGQGA